MDLLKVREITRSVQGEYLGETFQLSYRPAVITPDREQQFREGEAGEEMKRLLLELIADWDLYNGAPLPENKAPLTLETLNGLPTPLLSEMFRGILLDFSPASASAEPSAASAISGGP